MVVAHVTGPMPLSVDRRSRARRAGGWWRVRVRGLGLALALLCAGAAQATVQATDDAGQRVVLAAPARRIVSLAPHATELLFAAGAGSQVVGTVRYADFPEAARQLPRVGDALAFDLERIAALRPDLLVVWWHGSSAAQIERLRALHLPIFLSDPELLPQLGSSLRRLGTLAGTSAVADPAADALDAQIARLRKHYGERPPVRVFYQVWAQPLMTLNAHSLISDVIRLCGGINVFGDQPMQVPMPSAEAVLAARPQVLVTSVGEPGPDGRPPDPLAPWRGLNAFEPLRRHAVIGLPVDEITHASPRILPAAQRLCEALDRVRAGQALPLP